MNKFFYEVFENIPRQGPGMNSATRKAYQVIRSLLPAHPSILDIGCGKGVQTLELAGINEGHIHALDNKPFFLKCLNEEAEKKECSDRITCIEADMNSMPFANGSFDLIWSEGAVFIIGIREGLSRWKKLLKPNGIIVLSDLVWLTESRPTDIASYLEEECQYMLTIQEVLEEALKHGYRCIDHFTLPDEGWTREYFLPQKKVIADLRKKYPGNEEAVQTFDALDFEREIISRNLQYAGYEFFMFQVN